ncbi:hypothetical protein [Alteribacillus sp. HJP-4]
MEWEPSEKGEYTILSKASDSAGRRQSDKPERNEKGVRVQRGIPNYGEG